jgi:5'-methylthioadenosine phosphorylase
VGRLALVAGSALRGAELPHGDWELLQRHGEAAAYVLPHRVDHAANMRALADAGCDRVLAIGSVGGLRVELAPGTLLVPDDFVALDAAPQSALEGEGAHRTVGFDPEWRRHVLEGLNEAGAEARDGGVYWQANGPRFETPAEVRLIAAHADVVGMTIASECLAACELGLRYAALCMVDNLANGIGEAALGVGAIEAARARNRAALQRLLAAILPQLG